MLSSIFRLCLVDSLDPDCRVHYFSKRRNSPLIMQLKQDEYRNLTNFGQQSMPVSLPVSSAKNCLTVAIQVISMLSQHSAEWTLHHAVFIHSYQWSNFGEFQWILPHSGNLSYEEVIPVFSREDSSLPNVYRRIIEAISESSSEFYIIFILFQILYNLISMCILNDSSHHAVLSSISYNPGVSFMMISPMDLWSK